MEGPPFEPHDDPEAKQSTNPFQSLYTGNRNEGVYRQRYHALCPGGFSSGRTGYLVLSNGESLEERRQATMHSGHGVLNKHAVRETHHTQIPNNFSNISLVRQLRLRQSCEEASCICLRHRGIGWLRHHSDQHPAQ